jgi:tetratricopeptide (TPR) repeat protein
MSRESESIRKALQQVEKHLRKGDYAGAARAVRNGADALMDIPMTGDESEETERLLLAACDLVETDPELAAVFPDGVRYVPGQEQAVSELMGRLLDSPDHRHSDEERQPTSDRTELISRARAALQAGEEDDARNDLSVLAELYPQDGELHLETGMLFLDFGLPSDAAPYLQKAETLLPGAARVLNALGMVMRRMKRYEESERYFTKAVEAETGDPHIFFNQGRLYLDLEEWNKVVECADKALSMDPKFEAAAKMRDFAGSRISAG